MTDLFFSRREAVAALAAATALPLLARSSPALAAMQGGAAGDAEANTLLDSIAENLLRQSPESATSLGIDKGGAPFSGRNSVIVRSLANSGLPRPFRPT